MDTKIFCTLIKYFVWLQNIYTVPVDLDILDHTHKIFCTHDMHVQNILSIQKVLYQSISRSISMCWCTKLFGTHTKCVQIGFVHEQLCKNSVYTYNTYIVLEQYYCIPVRMYSGGGGGYYGLVVVTPPRPPIVPDDVNILTTKYLTNLFQIVYYYEGRYPLSFVAIEI